MPRAALETQLCAMSLHKCALAGSPLQLRLADTRRVLEFIWTCATFPARFMPLLWPVLIGMPIVFAVTFPVLRTAAAQRHGAQVRPLIPGNLRLGLVVGLATFLGMWAFIAIAVAILLIVPVLFARSG